MRGPRLPPPAAGCALPASAEPLCAQMQQMGALALAERTAEAARFPHGVCASAAGIYVVDRLAVGTSITRRRKTRTRPEPRAIIRY